MNRETKKQVKLAINNVTQLVPSDKKLYALHEDGSVTQVDASKPNALAKTCAPVTNACSFLWKAVLFVPQHVMGLVYWILLFLTLLLRSLLCDHGARKSLSVLLGNTKACFCYGKRNKDDLTDRYVPWEMNNMCCLGNCCKLHVKFPSCPIPCCCPACDVECVPAGCEFPCFLPSIWRCFHVTVGAFPKCIVPCCLGCMHVEEINSGTDDVTKGSRNGCGLGCRIHKFTMDLFKPWTWIPGWSRLVAKITGIKDAEQVQVAPDLESGSEKGVAVQAENPTEQV